MQLEENLLVVGDTKTRDVAHHILVHAGHQVDVAADLDHATEALSSGRYAVLVVDAGMLLNPDGDQPALLLRAKRDDSHLEVLALASPESKPAVLEALNRAISDYVPVPIQPRELIHRVERALEVRRLKLAKADSSMIEGGPDYRSASTNEPGQADLDIWLQAINLTTIGRLAGSVTHQINNPLTVVMANAQVMQMDTPPGSADYPILDDIVKASIRIRDLVERLPGNSIQQEYDWKDTSVNETLEGALALLDHMMRRARIDVKKQLGDLPAIVASPDHLILVWLNLLLNARDVILTTNTRGTIKVRSDNRLEGWVRIQISDNGPGLPEQARDHLFEPFFAVRPPGQGLGLGLFACRTIIQHHEGQISVKNNRPGPGATVTIKLSTTN